MCCIKDGVEIKVVQTFQLIDQCQQDVLAIAMGYSLNFKRLHGNQVT